VSSHSASRADPEAKARQVGLCSADLLRTPGGEQEAITLTGKLANGRIPNS